MSSVVPKLYKKWACDDVIKNPNEQYFTHIYTYFVCLCKYGECFFLLLFGFWELWSPTKHFQGLWKSHCYDDAFAVIIIVNIFVLKIFFILFLTIYNIFLMKKQKQKRRYSDIMFQCVWDWELDSVTNETDSWIYEWRRNILIVILSYKVIFFQIKLCKLYDSITSSICKVSRIFSSKISILLL